MGSEKGHGGELVLSEDESLNTGPGKPGAGERMEPPGLWWGLNKLWMPRTGNVRGITSVGNEQEHPHGAPTVCRNSNSHVWRLPSTHTIALDGFECSQPLGHFCLLFLFPLADEVEARDTCGRQSARPGIPVGGNQ